ncbi:uncharacterized protein A4U43_C05F15510 [Asparagus officinalis]|uniref:Uncharacterized protein n=1 Tax=Asparagus officinalis TaxID=4686 RepID=A0A5P1ERT4_ASPOF|nr:uncharacterized protein A4U43_C05F15510 [Asparagus officinalis]
MARGILAISKSSPTMPCQLQGYDCLRSWFSGDDDSPRRPSLRFSGPSTPVQVLLLGMLDYRRSDRMTSACREQKGDGKLDLKWLMPVRDLPVLRYTR